jgi:hypothetical protein
MPEWKQVKSEHELREAARRVAKANHDDLPAALKHFGYQQNEWFNGLPRDQKMRPVAR